MSKYQVGKGVNCTHCKTTVKLEELSHIDYGRGWFKFNSPQYEMLIQYSQCPECLKFLIAGEQTTENVTVEHQLWPLTTLRNPVPLQVPPHIAQDYNEAALILWLSPKASAALSRRCLQIVLREKGATKSKDLNDQINEVLLSLPSHIAQNLDTIRVVGNFAAHPITSQVTGEAEWNLDVLDALFDFYYVRPDLEQKKRDAINQKLQEAGRLRSSNNIIEHNLWRSDVRN